jgi:superfamily I DNA/RNA helicase/mRNA-degrading endonuclease RelE of RelBE toxin-antitoxin system
MRQNFLSELLTVPRHISEQLAHAQRHLERDPATPHGDTVKKLRGFERLWRYRFGDYRMIYAVEDDFVELLAIGSRGSIYTRFSYNPDQPDEAAARLTEAGLFPNSDLARRVEHDTTWMEYAQRQQKQLEEAALARTALPIVMTPDVLTTWRIPAAYHAVLGPCRQREALDQLSDTGHLPVEIALEILNFQYPKTAAEIAHEPVRIVMAEDDLIRYVEGDITHFLLRLDPHQGQLVDWALEGPTLVRGGPGSGKSTVALYRVRAVIERALALGQPPPAILFTTYTKALVSVTEELLPRLLHDLPDTADRVTVRTIDSLAHRLAYGEHDAPKIARLDDWREAIQAVRRSVSPETGGMEGAVLKSRLAALNEAYLTDEFTRVIEGRGLSTADEYLAADRTGRGQPLTAKMRRLVWAVYERARAYLSARGLATWADVHRRALENAQAAPRPFDHVFIDEAQDLTPMQLRLCVALVRDPRHVFLAADSAQSIYNRGFSFSQVDAALNVAHRTRLLRRNYRSTREIAEAAGEIPGRDAGDAESLAQEHVHFGPKPMLVFADTFEEQVAQIADYIRRSARNLRLPTGAAAVLCPTHALADQFAHSLNAAGVRARTMQGDSLQLDAPFVKVLTMHSAKGLEFPIVAVPSVDDGVMPRTSTADDEDDRASEHAQQRRLLFVAATRAMRALIVTCSRERPSPFLEPLTERRWEVVR